MTRLWEGDRITLQGQEYIVEERYPVGRTVVRARRVEDQVQVILKNYMDRTREVMSRLLSLHEEFQWTEDVLQIPLGFDDIYGIFSYKEGQNLEHHLNGIRDPIARILAAINAGGKGLDIWEKLRGNEEDPDPQSILVHRDNKPTNTLVPKKGVTYPLLDLDSLMTLDQHRTARVRTVTFRWAAPELYGTDRVHANTDLYGIGRMVLVAVHGMPDGIEVPPEYEKELLESLEHSQFDPIRSRLKPWIRLALLTQKPADQRPKTPRECRQILAG